MKEIKKFLEEHGLIGGRNRIIGEQRAKKENKIDELRNAIKQLEKLYNIDYRKAYSYLKHGVSPKDIFCPVCEELRKTNYRVELTCGKKDKEHHAFIQNYRMVKQSKTIQENYGVAYLFQSEEFKKNYRKIMQEKYGVDNPSKLAEIKFKKRETTRKNYGVDYYTQTTEYKKRVKKTNLDKYGVENPMQLHIFKEKLKDTNLKRYGVKFYTQTEEFKERFKKTSLVKYGVENPMQNPEIQKKIKESFISKYGVSNPAKLKSHKTTTRLRYNINVSNYEKLSKQYIENTFLDDKKYLDVVKISEFLNCDKNTTPYLIMKRFNVKYKKRRGTSNPEEEIIKFIKELDPNIEIITNSRKIIPPKELDIYLPEYNLAIEYNGLMFHSQGISKFSMFNTPDLNKNIHLEKTEACESKGIHLLHIFENEWLDPKLRDIWKSVIRNKLGKAQNKIGARKLTFATKEQLLKNSKAFLEENHLQGSGAIGSIRYGLVDKAGELLALMTFGKSRFSNTDYELIRFAIKKDWSIAGAASKLLKAFEKDYPNKKIVSYANRRWSTGNLYKMIGFRLKHISKPNFYVFHEKNILKLWHRVNFQKHKLKNKLENFDEDLTAEENLFNNGYRKIYDNGNYVFEK